LKSLDKLSKNTTFTFLLVLVSLIAFALVYFPTQKQGVGISPDAIQYIGTARNVIAGHGLLAYDNSKLLLWPPLYPLLLAFMGIVFKCDPLLTIGWLNSILFAMIVFFSGRIAFRLTKGSTLFALLTALFITFSIPLYGVTLMAWSEPLFILLTVLFFVFLKKYTANYKIATLLVLALLAALAAITRYVGIALIVTGVLCILVNSRSRLKEKILRVLFFGFVSSLPLAAWLVRNRIISGTFSGPRMLSSFTLLDNFHAMVANLFYWFFPKYLIDSQIFIAVLFFGLGLLFSYLFMLKFFHKNILESDLFPFLTFILLYVILLFITSKTGFWGLIDSRYLSPLFIPIALVLFTFFYRVSRFFMERFRKGIVIAVVSLVMIAFISYPMLTTIKNSRNPVPFREGYNPTSILASDAMQYLMSHPAILDDCHVYTNSPVELDFFAHFRAETIPTILPGEFSSLVAANIDQLKGNWPLDKSCLVWFNNAQYFWMYSLADLEKIVTLQVLYSFDDGTIYSMEKK
jgi:hypothetical protein